MKVIISKISKDQSRKNRAVAKIKQSLPFFCTICGRPGCDAAHLLPKSVFPEYYTHPSNIVMMCRECHRMYDDNILFRRQQKKLIDRVITFDPLAANRYFKL